MAKFNRWMVGLVALVASNPFIPAYAKSRAPSFLTSLGEADAPRGFIEMCSVDATFCTRGVVKTVSEIVTGGIGDRQSGQVPNLDSFARWRTNSSAQGTLLTSVVDTTAGATLNIPIRTLNAQSEIIGNQAVSTAWLKRQPNSAPVFWKPEAAASFVSDANYTLESVDLADRSLTMTSLPTLSSALVTAEKQIAPSPSAPAKLAMGVGPLSMPADRVKKLLNSVNRSVNRDVLQRTDLEIFGREEVWRRSGISRGAVGDCEDIAIEKRFELIASGFPANRLAFAVVYSQEAGLHTVLVARTDTADVVLDSRTPYVRPWSAVAYSWISVQSMTDPMDWRSIASVSSTA